MQAKKPTALNWIGGAWVGADTVHDSINSGTYEVMGSYADGGEGAAVASIAAAKRAFLETSWERDRQLRARVLNQLADAFERHRDDLVEMLSTENGKVKGEAAFEVGMVPSKLRFYASLVRCDYGRAVEPKPGSLSVVMRQAMGVAGVIVPWNSPVVLLIRSLAPALAAGCTTVVKMPGQSAQVASLICKVMSEVTDLPAGVINFFSEQHSEGSRYVIASPDVPVISFTGSSATGRAISAVGAKFIKRFGLELGGKTPMLVFDDADVDATVPALLRALTVFAGQFCMTGSRVLVLRRGAGAKSGKLGPRLRGLQGRPAGDPGGEMWPLLRQPQAR